MACCVKLCSCLIRVFSQMRYTRLHKCLTAGIALTLSFGVSTMCLFEVNCLPSLLVVAVMVDLALKSPSSGYRAYLYIV